MAQILFFMHLSLKILCEMAHSEDPDQTALLVCGILSETLMFKILGHLLYPKVARRISDGVEPSFNDRYGEVCSGSTVCLNISV